MRRWWPLLLVPLLLVGGITKKRGPGSRDTAGGGDAAMFAFCKAGGDGVGYNAATGFYEATCANFPWSARFGGTVVVGAGRVADWDTPTTSGGNAYKLTCTGQGTATTPEGTAISSITNLALTATASAGGASTLTDGDAAYAVNALRGYYIFTIAGTGSGQQRMIASNTATVITVGSAWAVVPDATTTYEVHNLAPADCAVAGEIIVRNATADVMIAQDLTKQGGTVYWPDLSNGKATMYVHNHCGRKGMGSGTATYVGNNCPVLQRQNVSHYQRFMELGFRNVKHNLGLRDLNLFDEETGLGREGVYLLNDTGGPQDQNAFYDPSDGGWVADGRSFSVGGSQVSNANCVPISNADPRCDVTQITGTGNSLQNYVWAWTNLSLGTNGPTLKSTADTTSAALICVNDTVDATPNFGSCRENPNIICSVAGTGARAAGGCDFGAGGDLGPCMSLVDNIEYHAEVDPARADNHLWVALVQKQWVFPTTGTYSTSIDVSYSTVGDVPNADCGTAGDGGTLAMGNTNPITGRANGSPTMWPLPVGNLDIPNGIAGTGQGQLTWLHQDWFSEDGGIIGGVLMPSGWLGRDVDADGTVDITHGDCGSGGDTDATDDSPSCDTHSVFSFMNIKGAGIKDSVVAYGAHDLISSAGSWFDSGGYGDDHRMKNVLIARGKRGRVADWTCVDTDEVTFQDNDCRASDGGIASVVTPWFNSRCAEMNGLIFRNNYAANMLGPPTPARHGEMRDIQMIGNYSEGGHIVISVGDGLLLENIQFDGGSLPGIRFHNFLSPVSNVTMKGIRGFGYNASSLVDSVSARALIAFGSIGYAAAGEALPTNLMRGFRIDDVWMESAWSDTALVAFDDAVDAGADQTGAIMAMRSSTVITNSGIDCVEGATGCVAVMVANQSGAAETAAADTGILLESFQPVIDNVYLNGSGTPDQPYPQQLAATCGDCDDAAVAGRICHIIDATAANTCTDAGADSILDTGTLGNRALCQCRGSSTVWIVLGE